MKCKKPEEYCRNTKEEIKTGYKVLQSNTVRDVLSLSQKGLQYIKDEKEIEELEKKLGKKDE